MNKAAWSRLFSLIAWLAFFAAAVFLICSWWGAMRVAIGIAAIGLLFARLSAPTIFDPPSDWI